MLNCFSSLVVLDFFFLLTVLFGAVPFYSNFLAHVGVYQILGSVVQSTYRFDNKFEYRIKNLTFWFTFKNSTLIKMKNEKKSSLRHAWFVISHRLFSLGWYKSVHAYNDDHFRDRRPLRPKNISQSLKAYTFHMNDLCVGLRWWSYSVESAQTIFILALWKTNNSRCQNIPKK